VSRSLLSEERESSKWENASPAQFHQCFTSLAHGKVSFQCNPNLQLVYLQYINEDRSTSLAIPPLGLFRLHHCTNQKHLKNGTLISYYVQPGTILNAAVLSAGLLLQCPKTWFEGSLPVAAVPPNFRDNPPRS